MLYMTEQCANCDKFEEKHKRLVTKKQKNLNVSAKCSKALNLPSDISSFIDNTMDNNHKIKPFMRLFWEQQKSTFSKKSVGKYHPMIIRFCLSLATKTGSAYDKLRNSNVLVLPSRKTSRDYRNAIKPPVGCNPKVIAELCSLTKDFSNLQKYICLVFDEIRLQSNLV